MSKPARAGKASNNILFRPRVRPWKILLPTTSWVKPGAPSSLILIYGFAGLVAFGTILLILPVSTASGHSTSLVDAFFTATSSVCVTGLVVVDTLDHWSLFGQIVILLLIQLGGFGFMTSATLFLMAFRHRIGLRERLLISESIGFKRLGGLAGLVKKMAVFTLIMEVIGASVFLIHFAHENSPGTALWKSIFQSISAFNNAGFDLFGNFRSLTSYQNDYLVILMTSALVILGGISYVVIADIFEKRGFGKLSLDSKLVLITTGSLLLIGTVAFLISDYNNPGTFGPLTIPSKLINAFFLSVTSRTAGFTTVEVSHVANYGLFLIMFLMFIGGASGSTAGGIKVNTFGMLFATILSTIRGKEHPGIFGREFSSDQIHKALTIAALSLGLISVVVLILTITEPFNFINLLFETVSAFGTVGLSTGITSALTASGKILIIITMFAGRLGPLAIMLALTQHQHRTGYHYPGEKIRIG